MSNDKNNIKETLSLLKSLARSATPEITLDEQINFWNTDENSDLSSAVNNDKFLADVKASFSKRLVLKPSKKLFKDGSIIAYPDDYLISNKNLPKHMFRNHFVRHFSVTSFENNETIVLRDEEDSKNHLMIFDEKIIIEKTKNVTYCTYDKKTYEIEKDAPLVETTTITGWYYVYFLLNDRIVYTHSSLEYLKNLKNDNERRAALIEPMIVKF